MEETCMWGQTDIRPSVKDCSLKVTLEKKFPLNESSGCSLFHERSRNTGGNTLKKNSKTPRRVRRESYHGLVSNICWGGFDSTDVAGSFGNSWGRTNCTCRKEAIPARMPRESPRKKGPQQNITGQSGPRSKGEGGGSLRNRRRKFSSAWWGCRPRCR